MNDEPLGEAMGYGDIYKIAKCIGCGKRKGPSMHTFFPLMAKEFSARHSHMVPQIFLCHQCLQHFGPKGYTPAMVIAPEELQSPIKGFDEFEASIEDEELEECETDADFKNLVKEKADKAEAATANAMDEIETAKLESEIQRSLFINQNKELAGHYKKSVKKAIEHDGLDTDEKMAEFCTQFTQVLWDKYVKAGKLTQNRIFGLMNSMLMGPMVEIIKEQSK